MAVRGYTESRPDWVTAMRYYHGHGPRHALRPRVVAYGLVVVALVLVTLLTAAGVIG